MERTYQRRRLGVLAGLLALVLAAGSVVGGTGGGRDQAVAAGEAEIHAAAIGAPTAVRSLDGTSSRSSSEVEGAPESTTTTAAPGPAGGSTTDTAEASTTTTVSEPQPRDDAETQVTASKRSVTVATAPSTTAAPAPTAAPTTTAAPATTVAPTTTAAPTTAAAPAGEDAARDPQGTQVWYDLADCESGGNWAIDSGNGYYGGLQFSLETWRSVGGTGYPHEHPEATQIEMGRRLQARQGWGAWPHCAAELGLI